MDLSFLHYKMESSDQVTDSIVLYCSALYCSALHCTVLLLCCSYSPVLVEDSCMRALITFSIKG